MSGGPIRHCGSARRRQLVAESNATVDGTRLNGIDFLEVVDRDAPTEEDRQRLLDVTFLRADGIADAGGPLLLTENFRIEGGTRIRDIAVLSVAKKGPRTLRLTLDRYGDHSDYRLELRAGADSAEAPPFIDPMLVGINFNFKVECPAEFDCEPPPSPRSAREAGPPINYLAKDYASFRQLMLDRMATTLPEWTERSPADLGVTLVETLAHAADQTSWFQDAVHTEAFLGRARLRQSILRHSRLLGYTASEGNNARVAVALASGIDQVGQNGEALLPAGTRLLTRPPRLSGTIPAALPAKAELLEEMIGAGSIVFETLEPVMTIRAARAEMKFHDWGDEGCCLLPGSTAAWLVGSKADLDLAAGDLLIFEERIPFGLTVDDPPDPSHRQVVRLSLNPSQLTDHVTNQAIVRIDWHEEDALSFPLTLRGSDGKPGAVAIGNVVLADEGRTVDYGLDDAAAGADSIAVGGDEETGLLPDDGPGTRRRYRLAPSPIVHSRTLAKDSRDASAASAFAASGEPAVAQVTLSGDGQSWTAVPDLLAADRFLPVVRVEPADDGGGYVLFGDGTAGRRPSDGASFTARIRSGGGRRGNVAAEAIGHVVANGLQLDRVRNPLPASGGVDPEPPTAIRIAAPQAFRIQRRAVTPADYVAAAEAFPGVQRAHATRRWTGSWHTVFLAVDRLGGVDLTEDFESSLRRHLADYRLAGHDLEIVEPRQVPLDIAFYVCVCGDHYPADVERELLDVFSAGLTRRGSPGFFHPDNFSFGDNVLLSRLIAHGMTVEGVMWMGVRDAAGTLLGRFGRLDQPGVSYEEEGEIPIAADEIARLDNDPNYPDLGRLRFIMAGGR